MRSAEKKKKKFWSRIPFILDPSMKIPKKNSKNIQQIIKLFPELFLAKTGWDRPKKGKQNFSSEFHSYSTDLENSEKNRKKILKIIKPLLGITFSKKGMI